jgi:hypothetical protein
MAHTAISKVENSAHCLLKFLHAEAHLAAAVNFAPKMFITLASDAFNNEDRCQSYKTYFYSSLTLWKVWSCQAFLIFD